MAFSSRLLPSISGLIPTSKPQFQYQGYNLSRTLYNNRAIQHVVAKNSRARVHYLARPDSALKFSVSVGRIYNQFTIDDDSPKEPFLLSLIKEALWALRLVASFLVEQPSQLKYIEWPSFQSTLKTATLTLILMALLIVALSSVDSALSLCFGFSSKKTHVI